MDDTGAALVTYHGGPEFLALVNGRLSVEGGVVTATGGPTIFPKREAQWDGQRLTLFGRQYEVGDEIQVGGGGGPLRMVREMVGGLIPPSHWNEEDTVFIVSC